MGILVEVKGIIKLNYIYFVIWEVRGQFQYLNIKLYVVMYKYVYFIKYFV